MNQVYTAYAESQKGLKELEKTQTIISKMLEDFDSLSPNNEATAADVAASARAVAEASAAVVTSYSVSQGDLMQVC